MLKFLVLTALLSLTSFARADGNFIQTSPYCYQGTMVVTSKDGSTKTKSVFLSFYHSAKDGDRTYFLVNRFRMDDHHYLNSGELVSPNVLQFNENDDFIPGGNASYNTDIELTFTKTGAIGSMVRYSYPKLGLGGFGEAQGVVEERGTLSLNQCLETITPVK